MPPNNNRPDGGNADINCNDQKMLLEPEIWDADPISSKNDAYDADCAFHGTTTSSTSSFSSSTALGCSSMAEAHSAVAFSFSVTPEGVNVDVNHEALWAVFNSGVRSWKKRYARLVNRFHTGVYPSSPVSLIVTESVVFGCYFSNTNIDPSFGVIDFLQKHLPQPDTLTNKCLSCAIFGTGAWFGIILGLRYTLKALLTYQGWMFTSHGNKVSKATKLWIRIRVYQQYGYLRLFDDYWLFQITDLLHSEVPLDQACVKILEGRNRLLYSYQASLPKLPVPALKQTMRRYLRSVRPLMDDAKYQRMVKLVDEFEGGIGPKLQRYLVLKSYWATNYVSDWWEEYVYLRGRSPIMVNSNFYGIDALGVHPTTVQAARGANIIYGLIRYRQLLDREKLPPIMINGTIPLCSWQYERQFNTTRIPGIETDRIVHYDDSKHIAVYHKGCYYKVYIQFKGKLLNPPQIEQMLQQIIDSGHNPVRGEKHLAALTAAPRVLWAETRSKHFCKGINKSSLHAIEKAAFVIVLDDESHDYDDHDPTKLDKFGASMLHGKCYDRWFDKSFTMVICANGRIGFNGEHSWADAPIHGVMMENMFAIELELGADAPIMGHLWEMAMCDDIQMGYRDDGHTTGESPFPPPNPIRLEWDISEECEAIIDNALVGAQTLAAEVDLHLLKHDAFGKGLMKKCKISPDAFIQMALQLAYYRDTGHFCLTYEASMTRLFREGRTETVRSCSIESVAWVKAMESNEKSKSECIALLREACDYHQDAYRTAMTGGGIDRHLFCLYVVSRYLGIDSPFLKEVLSEPWRLSTSQTPHQQTSRIDLAKNPEFISAGGGFGPVADDGYGVSYIIAGENIVFFHISSKRPCGETDSHRFGRTIQRSMADLKNLFDL